MELCPGDIVLICAACAQMAVVHGEDAIGPWKAAHRMPRAFKAVYLEEDEPTNEFGELK